MCMSLSQDVETSPVEGWFSRWCERSLACPWLFGFFLQLGWYIAGCKQGEVILGESL